MLLQLGSGPLHVFVLVVALDPVLSVASTHVKGLAQLLLVQLLLPNIYGQILRIS